MIYSSSSLTACGKLLRIPDSNFVYRTETKSVEHPCTRLLLSASLRLRMGVFFTTADILFVFGVYIVGQVFAAVEQ